MSKDNSRSKVMEAIRASLKSFCRMELPYSAYIDLAIDSGGIEESIMRADAGNQLAKKKMRHMAACYLSNDGSYHFGPMPTELRLFAGRELEKSSKGTPDSKKPGGGRPPRPYREKLWIAHWIYQAIQAGKTQNEACEAFAQFTDADGKGGLSTEQVRRIYVDSGAKQDIETLYMEIPKIKAAAIPIRCLD